MKLCKTFLLPIITQKFELLLSSCKEDRELRFLMQEISINNIGKERLYLFFGLILFNTNCMKNQRFLEWKRKMKLEREGESV